MHWWSSWCQYVGTFFDLLTPFALVMGLCTLSLFLTHGAVYLALKTTADVRSRARGVALTVGPAAIALMALAVGWQQVIRGTAISVTLGVLAVASLYPDVLPSTIDPAFSLTVENAASTPYTLTVMSWIALVFVPVILAYQAWSYRVFRRRISVQHIPESPTSVPAS